MPANKHVSFYEPSRCYLETFDVTEERNDILQHCRELGFSIAESEDITSWAEQAREGDEYNTKRDDVQIFMWD